MSANWISLASKVENLSHKNGKVSSLVVETGTVPVTVKYSLGFNN